MRHRSDPRSSITGLFCRRLFQVWDVLTASSRKYLRLFVCLFVCLFLSFSFSFSPMLHTVREGREIMKRVGVWDDNQEQICVTQRALLASMQLSVRSMQDAYPYLNYTCVAH